MESRSDVGDFAGTVWRPPPGKRGVFLHGRLVRWGGKGLRVRRLGGTRAGEIRLTRFLRNRSVTPQAMVLEAAGRTAPRCAGRHVLAIQDTTVFKSDGGGGLYLHAMLALDADDDAILGLVHADILSRDGGKRAQRRDLPVSAKESQRWLDGADRAAEVCGSAERVTVIADRESDIFEAFARRPGSVDLLVRAAQDRCLEDGGRLFALLDAMPPAASALLSLPARPGARARQARMAVRFTPAVLARPRNGAGPGLPAGVAVNMVDVREIDPADGQAVHWRLLTTLPVEDAGQALAAAELYRRRWAIEQLFRTLKTQGFDIEGLRIEDDAPRCNLVMAALVAAVTVQQLVHAREGRAGPRPIQPLTDAFEPEDTALIEALSKTLEGKTQRQKNPHPRGSLAFAAWVCARLGGWTGYYGKPGPVVMLQGWLQLQAAKQGFNLRAYPDV